MTLRNSVLSSVHNQEATPILSEVRSGAGRRVTTMMEIMVIRSRAESGNFNGSFGCPHEELEMIGPQVLGFWNKRNQVSQP